MQTSEQILDRIKKDGLNVQEISRKAGISSHRLYKWLNGKGKPKEDDAAKLKNWAAANLDIVPRGKSSNTEDNLSIPIVEEEPEAGYTIRKKLIAAQERNVDFLEKYVQTNLRAIHQDLLAIAAVVRTNQEVLAHVQAILEKGDRHALGRASRKTALERLETYQKTGIDLSNDKEGIVP